MTTLLDSEIRYSRETRDYSILICGQVVASARNYSLAEAKRTRLLAERRAEGLYATASELDGGANDPPVEPNDNGTPIGPDTSRLIPCHTLHTLAQTDPAQFRAKLAALSEDDLVTQATLYALYAAIACGREISQAETLEHFKLSVEVHRAAEPKATTISIPLTKGQVATIDASDYPAVARHRWFYVVTSSHRGYAATKINSKRVYLHRFLTQAPDDMQVDHIDNDPLNNRRSNLRLASNAQNQCNTPKRPGASSQFKGVCWNKAMSKWEAQIAHRRADGKRRNTFLGYFDTEVEAAQAYDAAAREHFGEFARTNLPDPADAVCSVIFELALTDGPALVEFLRSHTDQQREQLAWRYAAWLRETCEITREPAHILKGWQTLIVGAAASGAERLQIELADCLGVRRGVGCGCRTVGRGRCERGELRRFVRC